MQHIKEDRPVFETFSDNSKKDIFLNEVVIHSDQSLNVGTWIKHSRSSNL